MNNEPKISNPPSGTETSAPHLTVPMWIIALTLVLIYLGGVYFDHHSGWFDTKIYSPYSSAAELDAYQPKSGEAALLAHGKQVYEQNCGICHGTDGMGKPGQFPPLAGSEWVNAKDAKRLAQIPLEGLTGGVHVHGQEWAASMPAIGAGLSDADLASALTYIRSSWGNKGEAVTADDVKSVRATITGRPAINGEQELDTIKD